jgi:hypothetical protein
VVCDDGDTCTDDVCVDGTTCDNTLKPGIASVTCTCEQVAPDTCEGLELPRKVQRYVTRACRFFAQAVDARPKKQRKRLRQGARALRRAIAAISRAQVHGFSPECAADLVSFYRQAGDRATLLAEEI